MQQLKNLKNKSEGFTSLSQKDKGFTIIEVMIVLVIAAVIILIVFLAVPALQRNSRNNQRKNDAGRILSAAKEWSVNNSNNSPVAADKTEIQDLAGNLGHYSGIQDIQPVNVFLFFGFGNLTTSAPALSASPSGGDRVWLATGGKCADAKTLTAGGEIVAIQSVEVSSGSYEYICVG